MRRSTKYARKKIYYDKSGRKVTERIIDRIKVRVIGEITEDIEKAYNERLAIVLYKQLGEENCEKLLELLKEK